MTSLFRNRGGVLAALLLTGISACAPAVTPPPGATITPATRSVPSEESRRLAQYYARVQSRLLSQGLLRTDGGGPDVPFSTQTLSENFERVALYNEYAVRGGRFVAQQTPSVLRRWETPIRMKVIHGGATPPAQRTKDTNDVAAYTKRLARLTGHPITLTEEAPNFIVLFLNKDETATIGPTLRKYIPRISPAVVSEIENSPRNTFCAAYAMADEAVSSAYTNAVVLVKSEHRDLMRLSCIHEELAQAMGLSNDSPTARPSIFNDDEEFALLTAQDELLLRILYDRRLKLGMGPRQARPIVQQIAAELTGRS